MLREIAADTPRTERFFAAMAGTDGGAATANSEESLAAMIAWMKRKRRTAAPLG
jgi:hypothetical protein